jgi:hypothetical protein
MQCVCVCLCCGTAHVCWQQSHGCTARSSITPPPPFALRCHTSSYCSSFCNSSLTSCSLVSVIFWVLQANVVLPHGWLFFLVFGGPSDCKALGHGLFRLYVNVALILMLMRLRESEFQWFIWLAVTSSSNFSWATSYIDWICMVSISYFMQHWIFHCFYELFQAR